MQHRTSKGSKSVRQFHRSPVHDDVILFIHYIPLSKVNRRRMIDDKVNWASKVDEVWIFTESVNDISHSGQVNQRRQTPIHVADVKNVS